MGGNQKQRVEMLPVALSSSLKLLGGNNEKGEGVTRKVYVTIRLLTNTLEPG